MLELCLWVKSIEQGQSTEQQHGNKLRRVSSMTSHVVSNDHLMTMINQVVKEEQQLAQLHISKKEGMESYLKACQDTREQAEWADPRYRKMVASFNSISDRDGFDNHCKQVMHCWQTEGADSPVCVEIREWMERIEIKDIPLDWLVAARSSYISG